MNTYELEIYLNPISGTTTEYFLAENWEEATKKALKLFTKTKKGQQEDEQVEILRLEKLCELTEVR